MSNTAQSRLLCADSCALCRPLLPDAAGRAVRPAAAGLLTAGDLLPAPPGGRGRGQRGGQGKSPRHLQQTASPAATGGRRPARAAGTTGTSSFNFTP